jgi:hypothetical protein
LNSPHGGHGGTHEISRIRDGPDLISGEFENGDFPGSQCVLITDVLIGGYE